MGNSVQTPGESGVSTYDAYVKPVITFTPEVRVNASGQITIN